jgi:uncharacterized protein YndB with AHSA1/START domain
MSDKVKFQLEFPVRSSPKMLYQYVSTPSGLSEWFANDVNFRGEVYTFFWDDSEERAKLMSRKPNVYIRMKWEEDDDPKSYFEFRIVIDELTKDVSLIVTDFADEDDLEGAKLLWDTQIHELLHTLGS